MSRGPAYSAKSSLTVPIGQFAITLAICHRTDTMMSWRCYLIATSLLLFFGCRGDDDPPAIVAPEAMTSATPIDAKAIPVRDQWPFSEAENTAVITLTRILNRSKPILYVVHNEEGDWQFLDGGDVSEEDAATVSLKNITDHDPSVKSLADLPVGWAAHRTGSEQEWQRFQR